MADRPEALAFVTAAAGGGTGRRFQGKAATATHRAEAIALLGRTLS
ncbi:MAG: hypothetical protein BWX64_02016 [Acidobacteria bacterium ADurb.Bin051]|nr:MAG: hypothetical protein BWX64_02016 [Acidobacteria bacterium ADurb.Bin051]